MDFSKIRYFLMLAEHLNYTKASSQLYISQSMLSRHIKSAEEEFGVVLFMRNTRGVTLTPAGSVLANGLRNLSIEYSALLKQAHSIHSGASGDIRIGVIVGYTLGHLSELIARYEARYPGLRIVLSTVESPGTLCQEIAKNKLDFGIGMRIDTMYYPNIASQELFRNPLCVVMSKRHRFADAAENSLSIQDLRDETFITPADETSTAYRKLLARCSKAGYTPKVITVQNIVAVALWVEANYGVTFLHKHNAFGGSHNLVFHDLSDVESDESSTMYWNSESRESRVLAFVQYICEAVQSGT